MLSIKVQLSSLLGPLLAGLSNSCPTLPVALGCISTGLGGVIFFFMISSHTMLLKKGCALISAASPFPPPSRFCGSLTSSYRLLLDIYYTMLISDRASSLTS